MILSVDGCEIGWLDGGGRFCYHFGTTAMTFGAAQEVKNQKLCSDSILMKQYCWNWDSVLAEFPGSDEERLLKPFLPTEVFYWIGLTDISVEGKFRWVESHQEPNYDNWGNGQPNNFEGNQDCVTIDCLQLDCLWNDMKCNLDHFELVPAHALCQKPK